MRVLNYFKNRRFGWWLSSTLFVSIITLLLVPSWRIAVFSYLFSLSLGSPDIIAEDNRQQLPLEVYNFSYRNMAGEEQFLRKKPKTVHFINFWTTWCHHCIAEMPSIEELYADFGEDVNFVIYSPEKDDVIRAFQEKKQFKLPIALGLYQLPEYFDGFRSYPTTLIISKKGKLAALHRGRANWNNEEVRELLTELVNE